MKIALNTPEKLILDDRPWILGGCLVVLILVFAGFGLNALLAGRMGGLLGLVGAALWAVALVVFVRRTTISLDRQMGQMTREVSSLRAKSGQNWPLEDIRRAELDSRLSRDSSGAGRSRYTQMHRVVVQWNDGRAPLPLTEVYTSGPNPAVAVDTLNRWLDVTA